MFDQRSDWSDGSTPNELGIEPEKLHAAAENRRSAFIEPATGRGSEPNKLFKLKSIVTRNGQSSWAPLGCALKKPGGRVLLRPLADTKIPPT